MFVIKQISDDFKAIGGLLTLSAFYNPMYTDQSFMQALKSQGLINSTQIQFNFKQSQSSAVFRLGGEIDYSAVSFGDASNGYGLHEFNYYQDGLPRSLMVKQISLNNNTAFAVGKTATLDIFTNWIEVSQSDY